MKRMLAYIGQLELMLLADLFKVDIHYVRNTKNCPMRRLCDLPTSSEVEARPIYMLHNGCFDNTSHWGSLVATRK